MKKSLFFLQDKLPKLRPYVRRKSDLPLYIGQIHAFYFDTTPYTLNDMWTQNQFDWIIW